MQRLLSALFLLAMSSAAVAQSNAGQPAPSAQTQTIHAGAQIVVVDVSVTDGAGKPIRNLKASDFTLTESGKPQTIDHFEEHAASPTMALPPMPRLEPGTYTNFSFAPQDGPLNVLLIDMLNTPMDSQSTSRQKLLAFLSTFKPTQRVAIFGLSTRLFLLQGFTSDPELLRSAVSGKAANGRPSPLLNESGQPMAVSDQLASLLGNDPDTVEMLANLRQFEATVAAQQTRDRALLTLTAFNQLAHYLGGLSGRKNVMWVSGSFPLNIMPDDSLKDPFRTVNSMEDDFRKTTNLLTRAQVSVFPIDARGLFSAPTFSASNSNTGYIRNQNKMNRELQTFSQNTFNDHATMFAMADATGGKAFVDNNDISGAVNAALNEGSTYYTLVYSPTNRSWDGGYRKIELRTDVPGKPTLHYRRGYYAENPQPSSGSNNSATQVAGQKIDPMIAAMQRGAPDPTELLFKVKVVRSGENSDTLAEGNVSPAKIKPPYRTLTIYLAGSAADVTFRPLPDGNRAAALRFSVVAYDQDGQPLTVLDKPTHASIPPDAYKQVLTTGVQYTEQISIPAKGEYFLRIGVQDLFSGKVGALEVPTHGITEQKQ